jgi:hypothetical protein
VRRTSFSVFNYYVRRSKCFRSDSAECIWIRSVLASVCWILFWLFSITRNAYVTWTSRLRSNILTLVVFIVFCCCCSCRWSETMSLNCGHQRTCCSSLRWEAIDLWARRAIVEWFINILVMMGWDWRLWTAAFTNPFFIPGWFAMWTMVMVEWTKELGVLPGPLPHYLPQIPHWPNRASGVRGWWLTTWAILRPTLIVSMGSIFTSLMHLFM